MAPLTEAQQTSERRKHAGDCREERHKSGYSTVLPAVRVSPSSDQEFARTLKLVEPRVIFVLMWRRLEALCIFSLNVRRDWSLTRSTALRRSLSNCRYARLPNTNEKTWLSAIDTHTGFCRIFGIPEVRMSLTRSAAQVPSS